MTIKTEENDITPAEYKMLVRSLRFIDANREITTEHLPDEFIKLWSVRDFTTNLLYKAKDTQMLVFRHILELHGFSRKEQKQISSSYRFILLFHHFQIILAAVAYSRKNHIPIAPYPIFDAGRYIVPHLDCGGALMRQYEIITRGNML